MDEPTDSTHSDGVKICAIIYLERRHYLLVCSWLIRGRIITVGGVVRLAASVNLIRCAWQQTSRLNTVAILVQQTKRLQNTGQTSFVLFDARSPVATA